MNIPSFGLGLSYQRTRRTENDASQAVANALKCGYKLIDTAAHYRTEVDVGRALVDACAAGVISSAQDVFVTTKLWPGDFDNLRRAYGSSCAQLGRKPNLYLVHYPEPFCASPACENNEQRAPQCWQNSREARECVWRALIELRDEEDIFIGVSNFQVTHLEQLFEDCGATLTSTPYLNQIEFNVLQQPQELLDYCKARRVLFQGYCPFGKGEVLKNKEVIRIANELHVSSSALCLQFCKQRGVYLIPKANTFNHCAQNIRDFENDFSIPQNVMHELIKLGETNLRVTWDSSNVE